MATVQWGLPYEQLVDACIKYYGGIDNYTAAINSGELTTSKYAEILLQSGYTVEQNVNGEITYIGVNEFTPATTSTDIADPSSVLNSNSQSGTYRNGYTVNSAFGTQGTGKAEDAVKATKAVKYTAGVAGGLGHKILGTTGKVLAAVAAYNTGLNLGKKIDKALYEADPDFWDEKGMQNMDPDTWGEIANNIDSPLGKFGFSMLADVYPDEKTGKPTMTMYSQDLQQAYFAKWLDLMGFNDKPMESSTNSDDITIGTTIINAGSVGRTAYTTDDSGNVILGTNRDGGNIVLHTTPNSTIYITDLGDSQILLATETASGSFNITSAGWGVGRGTWSTNDINGQKYHYIGIDGERFFPGGTDAFFQQFAHTSSRASLENIGYVMCFGNYPKIDAHRGVSDQDGATQFDNSGLTQDSSVEDYLEAMKKQYPDLYNNRIEITIAQPDGTTKTITYWPTAFANDYNGDNQNQPITNTDTVPSPQVQPQIDSETATDTQIATLIKLLTETDPENMVDPKEYVEPDGKTKIPTTTDNPPDTGGGDTPTVILPEGHASSLYAIYNPTLSQVNSLGAWLWSSDFIDQILKLFSDPMQAIIGLHKIYCTPATGAEQNIKVGYLDSGVPSKIVTDQYTTVDCGSINLFEYFGNVFDYDPYTQLRLYLPFIGIVDIDTADAMRGVIHVVYHVDVLSGSCLAEVRIQRDAAGGTLYQYAGNAAVTMPISSGSYIGVIANVVGVASSAIGGFASGGVAGGIAGGVTGALTRRGGTQIQHSGNFSGNAGAMGIKKPYLIIERPQTALAKNYQNYIGNPSNETVVLSSCTGYIKVKEVHLENVPATQAELDIIEQELKAGVII